MVQHGVDYIDQISGDIKEDLLKRLRRIEGQVRGLQRMIEEERSCQEVVYQAAAVKAAVVQVAMTILSNQLATCLAQEMAKGGNPEAAVKRFTEVFKKFY
ncbi:MAG TPA: metal-sensitive transcriptional regulator [Firmicutes bacterium]|uniref:Metal-sensitive transcriptional regulator n=1 Tax=Capillibacterium thermochitinicola TaxID=2699427 RepID=A0A8J6I049_9FIRM|nr:metal-sensitive transcriptional regulator [Capillibacterium thermochitinicola]MBA2133155.1 metal-sensitive transcriptional regulator [Capillibacterium thermochitinicola]HHW11697.1 metal-sensitive transcriptional regulator [Bacillota bacterium]